MGKFLKAKHSNVNTKILRIPCKSVGVSKNVSSSDSFSTTYPLRKLKRKLLKGLDDIETIPAAKKQKLDVEINAYLSKTNIPCIKNELEEPQVLELNVQLHRSRTSNCVRLTLNDKDNDLFFADEHKASYTNFTYHDWLFHIFDEIALEGLDGITTEALWKRLNALIKWPLSFDHIKYIIWNIICLNKKMRFYQLPQERSKLLIYDRYSDVDQELGVVKELLNELPDIYPIEISKGNMGSCATYFTRMDISNIVVNNTLKEVENIYGRKLVIVADYDVRKNALYHETSDPVYETAPVEYCLLERVGRSRELGEVTQGNMSLTSAFSMDPKSLFHYKKHLIRNNLLAKQFFYVRSSLTVQNKSGRLLHLRRFYNKKKSKNLLIAENLINLLKKKPGFRAELAEIRSEFPLFNFSFKRLFRIPEFQKYVKTFVSVPYREIYPDAKRAEWQLKNKNERQLRVVELKDPYVNICASWNDSNTNFDSDEEEADDTENNILGFKSINVETTREIYLYILSKGRAGCSLREIYKYFDIEKLLIRSIVKRLKYRNFIQIKRVDSGKQRIDMYIAVSVLEGRNSSSTFLPQPTNLKQPSSVLEKLKERQRQHINKENNTLEVYTKQQYELDEQKFLLNERSEMLPLEIAVPKIVCKHFVKPRPDIVMNFEDIAESLEILKCGEENQQIFNVNLSFKGLTNTITISDINAILQNIDSNTSAAPTIKSNYVAFETNKYSFDYITKLFLLKALFNEIDSEIFNRLDENYTSNKLEDLNKPSAVTLEMNEPPEKLSEGRTKLNKSKEKLNYMGAEPIVVYETVDDKGVVTKILQSSLLQSSYREDVRQYETYSKANMTDRVVDRINIILKTIQECEIVEDVNKFLKIISDEEKKEGYDKKIDRKSLCRLFVKLVSEGYVKLFKLIIQDSRITKQQTFLCKPTVDYNHSIIKSTCEQTKWKFFVGVERKNVKPTIGVIQQDAAQSTSGTTKQPKTASPFVQSDIVASISELKELNKLRELSLKNTYKKTVGKTYGFGPKFVRMRILHEFLFYLIYEFNRNQKRLSDAEVLKMFKCYNIILTEEHLKDMPPVYCKDISWKMFIPPLPKHKGWQDGWALLCDIVLRLPLSVLTKVTNVPYEEKELVAALSHPIKKYFLMKNQSDAVRNVVLFKRKYLFDIHEVLCQLAYCGLLQFGPEKFKEKDQTFIYLNRRGSLLDTTSSAPGYHKVAHKEYPVTQYFFNRADDLESYWYTLYNISMSTKLNARNTMIGKTITLSDAKSKPSLVKALSSKTPKEALESDTGEIPGDKRGAAGLDSALWVHLARNWFWVSHAKKSGAALMGLKQDKLNINMENVMPYEEITQFVSPLSNKVYLPKPVPKTKQAIKPLKHRGKKLHGTSKKKVEYRLILKKKDTKLKREYYDDIDKAILKKKKGYPSRANWSAIEDKIVYLGRIVSVFLNPKNIAAGKQLIPYHVLRDILHRVVPHSRKDKTSRACQRRIKILMRLDPNCIKLEANASSLFKLEPISKYFSSFINQIVKEIDENGKQFKPTEHQLNTAFIFLMSYCIPHREEVEQMLHGVLLTEDHLKKENLKYTEEDLKKSIDISDVNYFDPKNEVDLKKEVLKGVLHSSLGNRNDYAGWAYHLFRIYEKFSDDLIRQTLMDMKDRQFISIRKLRKEKFRRGHIPFLLSNYYVYSQGTTFSDKTALEAYKTFNALISKERRDETFLVFNDELLMDEKKYGQLLGVNEVATFWGDRISIKFCFPEQPIILDPKIKDHSELVDEIAKRYQLGLKKSYEECEKNERENPTVESDVSLETPAEPASAVQDEKTSLLDPDTVEDTRTIENLQSWLNDCMVLNRVRSPSPEFFEADTHAYKEIAKAHGIKTDLSFLNEENPIRSKDFVVAIPTLEEIKEEMLKESSLSEEREIPYITDLTNLLSENYDELNSDVSRLNRLKDHFIAQYLYAEDMELDDVEDLNAGFPVVEFIENHTKFDSVINRVKRDMIIKQPVELEVLYENLRQEGATEEDINLFENVICYVESKGALGATGKELKERFLPSTDIELLQRTIHFLVQCNIFLQAGVCTITFVHYTFQSSWLIETFHLSSEELKELEKRSKEKYSAVKEKLNKRLETTSFLQVKVFPWSKLDGSLNVNILKSWLSKMLSHCIDNPKITMHGLCEKFVFLKPVDIYYLLEVLSDLGCLNILTENGSLEDLWSEWTPVELSYASFLDDFEKVSVEPTSYAMICVGSFLTKIIEK